ncbi:GNAT family N-acetyltransferase [Citrobacter freundii]|uniref:GNAT family N-acetyltransferase n=1 Tax=Citrobacter freundii TaxID=546 RepID=UPI001902A03A|nr:GNAT family N-acetyltransferase [Citrobacter freundii]MBJ9311329.1 GNAT family N-acetyltransferase [Citrobacter freundii]HEI8940838.1 GNAT family N-acetyltransferase [Citrobacter freundii]HEJ0167499.1 GNAT family N-acetyltransferase [Citrobacter freundii]
MVYRNDAEWMKYQGFKGLTKEDYEAELLGVLTLTRGIQLAIVNKLTQVLIGDIYLRQQCDVFWLGYTISPSYARQGYATEAITATIDWIKENGFSLIKAGVNPENTLSIKLLIRIGFNFSGIEEGEHIYVLDLTKGE